MSIRIACPSCHKVYNLAENMQGKTVVCHACESPFAVSAVARNGCGEDSEPQLRSAERRSRRNDKDSPSRKNLLPTLVGIGAAAVILIGLLIGAVLLIVLNRFESSNQEATAAKESSPASVSGKVEPTPLVANEPPLGPVKMKVDLPPTPPDRLTAGPATGDEAAIPPGPVPADMATDIVKKVKHSTVYLRVSLPSGQIAQGSGFFALERGLVITNAHVVGMKRSNNPPRGIEVVIHSGETGEAKLAGIIVGLDRENDLAVLRVREGLSRLPPPLPVATATELTETQNVYIFGFPFGAQLGKNITISKSAISSLRRGDDGVLKTVQVNGGMNPGNSGGPVTDARGVVVGVSVAGISGTQINFAIPGDFIQPLVEWSKNNPLDLTQQPPSLAKNEPPAAPPAAEKGRDSGAGLKIGGDVYTFVKAAIHDQRVADVDIRGFTLHKNTYRDVCKEGGVLIGFQVGLGKFAKNDIVKSLRPIYLTRNGMRPGKWIGPAPATSVTIRAKPGYVVSAISLRTAVSLQALTLTFAKLGKDGLDLSDTYTSKQVGGNGGRPSEIAGNGGLFVGVTGHISPDGSPSSLGLVAVLPEN